MVICNKNKCTGCGICASVCTHSCIHMEEDLYGESHPVVNELNCVQCGICKKACPNNTEPVYNYPQKCYAAWITDEVKRAKSATGGLASIIAEYVIKQGGVVFGTAYDTFFVPRVTYTESMEGVERYKGSKYAQSILESDVLRTLKSFLDDNRLVLFIGTPCQVAGIRNFLRKDYQNFVAIDLICHGVCPTKYFTDEVAHIVSKNKIKNISDIRFRGNDGYNYKFSIWQQQKQSDVVKEEIAYLKPRFEQPYFAGFMLGITLRENCYTCNYARPERVGDITVGDFLRLGKTTPFPYKVKQVSVVLTNNSKGDIFYKRVVNDCGDDLMCVEREYAERLVYKPSLLEPFKKHPKYEEFRRMYLKKGYVKAIRSTLRFYIIKKKCHNIRIKVTSFFQR